MDGSIDTPSLDFDKTAGALTLFQGALPTEFFQQQRTAAGLPVEEAGFYTTAVVVMLMIMQRLVQGKGALSGAVQQLLSGQLGDLVPDHKRIREDTASSNTGTYSRARTRLPKAVTTSAADRVAGYLLADHPEALPGLGIQAFLVDGSSITLSHTEALLEVYPAASNQHGEGHWSVMRVVVAHDVVSGIALRPAFGPMYGDQAVSEQALAEQIIDRMPVGSVAILDRNFGVFSVASYAASKQHPLLARMTDARARALLHGKLPQQTDQWVDWKPSRWERTRHPDLPADACIRVRLIATRVVRKGKVIQLYLVTTLDLAVEQIVALYGLRWNIELDLRSLKQTVHLHSLRALTPDMAEKELVLAVTAYNFVRAAICAAAQAAGMDPRQISFSRAQDVVNAWMPNLQAAASEEQYDVELQRMLRRIAQCKLPQTSHRPSYPRAIWPRCNAAFPKRKPAKPKPQVPGSSH